MVHTREFPEVVVGDGIFQEEELSLPSLRILQTALCVTRDTLNSAVGVLGKPLWPNMGETGSCY